MNKVALYRLGGAALFGVLILMATGDTLAMTGAAAVAVVVMVRRGSRSDR